MLFREIVLQNFGPYRGRQSIDLSIEKGPDSYPIVLIGGMNGGGKTTLMDAIRLALYGARAQCSSRGSLSYGEFLTQCVNRETKGTEETAIELEFEHLWDDQNVIFRLRRRWLRHAKEDVLDVIANTWLDETISQNWDEQVEAILPLGISNLFLFDGEQVKELAEQEAPPPQVVEAIQSLLGLDLAERLATDLEILVQRKRKDLATEEERLVLLAMENEVNNLTIQYDQLQEEIKELQLQVERAKEKQNLAWEKYTMEGGKIAVEHQSLKKEIEQLKKAIENQVKKLAALAETLLPLALIIPLLDQVQAAGEDELKNVSIWAAQAIINERDQRLLAYLETISSSIVEKVQEFLQQENQVLAGGESDLKPRLGVDREILTHLNQVLIHQLPELRQTAKREIQVLQDLEEKLIKGERELIKITASEINQSLKIRAERLQKETSDRQMELKHKQAQGEAIDIQRQKAKKELEDYGKKQVQTATNDFIIEKAERVQATLKQFKKRLILRKLNKLETEITECFRYLLHKSDLVHRVTVDADTFSLALYSPEGKPVPKHRLSAGEKQLLAIAFLWGLARVSERNLPVAIDTPLGRLDSSHRSHLVQRYFPSASPQVILLSTDTEIGKLELKQLQKQEAIARSYLLEYNPNLHQTEIKEGYFW